MKNFSNLLIILFILFVFTLKTFAASEQPHKQMKAPVSAKPQSPQIPQQKNTGAKPTQTPQEKRQQFEQDAVTAVTDVEVEYAKVVSWVNSDQIPDDANRNTALKNIAKNRKYLPVFNKQPKGLLYYPLSAWVYYYDNKPDRAIKQAVAGQKLAPHNSSVAKTCFALSLIYKDYTTTAEVLANRSTAPQETESNSTPAQPVSSNLQPIDIELNLDVNSIRQDLLGKVFDIRPSSTSQTGKNLLCVLLWKIDSNELDRFAAPPPPIAAVAKGPNEPNAPAPAPVAQLPTEPQAAEPQQNIKERTLISALKLFSKLQNRFAKDSKIVFMGINLNDPSKTDNVKNWLGKNPQSWQTSMPSADLQKKITSLFSAVPDKPAILISGPDSTIRYVGDVNGFLPQMIIRNILNNPKEFEEPNEPNRPKSSVVVEPVKIPPAPREPNNLHRAPAVRETNEIHKQSQVTPPHPAAANPVAKQQQNDDVFDPQAEDLLNNAKAFIDIGNKLPNHIYAKPVEMCRTVIKDYPNTKYAERARILLRGIPERFRARYDITDQELGL
jgi:hypothetical protein